MINQNSRMARRWGALAAGLCMAFVSLGAAAQNAIEGVTGSIQGGAEVVRIDLTQPLSALPTGFTIQSPARVALDFPGVTNNMGRSMVDFNQGNLRSVNVVQAGDRTRVVLNLKQAAGYKAEIQGKSLLVALDPAVTVSPNTGTAAAAPTFAEDRNRDVLPLKDLDFRRTPEGAGKVVVNLANSQVGVDIRQQGANLVVEFLKTSLPEGLRRRLDVGDFGTPIQTVTTFQNGDRVRMLIEPKGDWEHSAYQSDSQFVVEVRQRKIDPTKLSQGPGYSGEKLSLNFQNIEIRSLLQVIADFTNFNIITSDSVSGTVTLRLKDVPWDQALDIIMQTKNLGIRKNGNVLWIAPKDEITLKEKADLQSRIDLQNLEPLRTQSFQLNYTKAVDIATQLMGSTTAGGGAPSGGGQNASILSPRGSVIAESRTNQLFVSDIASRLERVAELIAKLDIPVRQVLIEARIVEATDTFGKSLGIKLGGGAQIRSDITNANIGSNAVVGSNATTSGQFVNLPAVGQNAYPAATFAISLFGSNAARFISLELSALEADGKGKVVSSPRVVTADQTKALIEQGTELPYQVATSSGATSIAFRKANLKLEVTPQITPEGNIILDLDVNKDSVGQATSAGFAINTKHIKTQVLVENGGTVVIGGIFELNETDSETKVPGLGDIPVAGALFRSRSRTANKQEMLVFITPKMISDRAGAR